MAALIENIDYRLTNGTKSQQLIFTKKLKENFSKTGFFILENHPIAHHLLTDIRPLLEKFFKKVSTETKLKNYDYSKFGGNKGYTPPSIETGEYAKIPDLKHFFQITGDRSEFGSMDEVPGLKDAMYNLYDAFFNLYYQLMCFTALTLSKPYHYFTHELGCNIMRFIHYPAHENIIADDDQVTHTEGGNALGMCASQHTDIDDLTLLYATEKGLQLLHEGKWVPVTCEAGTMIINIGDMLKHLTAGFYKSGIHKVVCEKNMERFSIPFFGHRVYSANLKPIVKPTKTNGEYSKIYKSSKILDGFPYQTEGEYLNVRLKQIGLIK